MADVLMSATFQNVHEPNQIRIHIGMGIGERIANSGLSRQVNYAVEFVRFEQFPHSFSIFQRQLFKVKAGTSRQLSKSVQF